ncbi:MAG: response regulator [Balneolaceae bacterium]|nr:response regulator [Balneolaceae bacterium]
MDSSSKKVLIVEDDNLLQVILEKMLVKLGHTVLGKVSEGSKAIKSALKYDAVDLILMDIRLEDDIDGIEAMKQIREKSNVKVIFITGNSEPSNIKRAKETGYVDFISKPVSQGRLSEALSKAFPID